MEVGFFRCFDKADSGEKNLRADFKSVRDRISEESFLSRNDALSTKSGGQNSSVSNSFRSVYFRNSKWNREPIRAGFFKFLFRLGNNLWTGLFSALVPGNLNYEEIEKGILEFAGNILRARHRV
ncbi:hypothetical protein DLM78_20335 [Leptospira stimsonii]|uniref:Uncharacterized protein n=1 Tax=Leptospira stimsonii TaxID=2202203 RepID=A0A8B3CNX2_9LEPT|nr:hypothetical protein DLM78_20335 [Leptospira stimsonii]